MVTSNYIIYVLLATFISGCTYNFHRDKLVEKCFSPFESISGNYINNGGKFLTLWTINGNNVGDDYLMSIGIVGHIISGRVAGYDERIGGNETFYFTGEVVKYFPSWGEHHIGGSNKNSLPIVIYNNKKYLIISSKNFNNNWYESLPEQCKY